MNAVPIVIVGLSLLSGVVYMAIDGHKKENEALANSLNVAVDEKSAFFACQKQMSGKSAYFRSGEASTSVVPPEICACQATGMVAVFKPESYNGHGQILDYLINKDNDKKPPELDNADLKAGVGSQDSIFRRLSKTLLACHAQYEKKFEAEQREARRRVCANKLTSKELFSRVCSS